MPEPPPHSRHQRTTRGTALVTGGAGFIGSHLVEALLSAGWAVTAMDDLSTGSGSNLDHVRGRPGFRFVSASVLDAEVLEPLVAEADCLFHLAAAVGVRLIVEQPLRSVLTNIRGTDNVLAAADRHRKRILLTSTSEIYGKGDGRSGGGVFHEDDDRVLGPTTRLRWSYSAAKAVDEVLAYAYHRERNLPTIVIRLFNTVGPRQTGQYGMVLPRFVGQALRGEPLTVYGDGTQSRVFTYVGDVVQAVMRLMAASTAPGRVFNVAGHEEVTIGDLASRVIARTRSRSCIVHLDGADVYGADFEDTARRAAETSRLEATVGYRCETRLDAMIDSVIGHMLSSGCL